MSVMQQRQHMDLSMKATSRVLSSGQLADHLGRERVGNLSDLFDRVEPVIPKDGFVDLSDLDRDAIPFTVLNKKDGQESEPVVFSLGSSNPFSTRQESTILEGLAELVDDPELYMGPVAAQLSSRLGEEVRRIRIGTNGGAFAVKRAVFPHNPDEIDQSPIMSILARPGIMFPMHDTRVEPDVFLHELTHVDQKETNALNIFTDQTDVNLYFGGEELEAYFVGAAVRKVLSNLTDERVESIDFSNPSNKAKYMQILVDKIRREHLDADDPFLLTDAMFQAYMRERIDYGIMSNAFDFAASIKSFKKQMQA